MKVRYDGPMVIVVLFVVSFSPTLVPLNFRAVTIASDEWREEATGLTVIRLERQWRLMFDPSASFRAS